jgi:hypothetical protein
MTASYSESKSERERNTRLYGRVKVIQEWEKSNGKRPRRWRKDDIKMDLKKEGEGMDWTYIIAWDREEPR